MRIIGGRHKGRSLAAPAGRDTRPTSERTREAIFNVLTHGIAGPGLDGATIIDVFAGTGALGLEALSRGAQHCTFVENHRDALKALRANIATLNETSRTTVLALKAAALPPPPSGQAADYAFLDAPYHLGLTAPALETLAARGWLHSGTVIIAEVARNESLDPPDGFTLLKTKDYGAARAVFLKFAPAH